MAYPRNDVGSNQIKSLEQNGHVSVFAGSGQEGLQDGNGSVATFLQVTGMCTEFHTVFLTDVQAGTIRMITSGSGMARYLQNMGLLYKAFNVALDNENKESLSNALNILENMKTYFHSTVDLANELQEITSKTNGPQDTLPAKTLQSIDIICSEISYLHDLLISINPDYIPILI